MKRDRLFRLRMVPIGIMAFLWACGNSSDDADKSNAFDAKALVQELKLSPAAEASATAWMKAMAEQTEHLQAAPKTHQQSITAEWQAMLSGPPYGLNAGESDVVIARFIQHLGWGSDGS